MAVYTPLTDDDISTHLARYELGQLKAWRGIAEGVENSNFLLETAGRKYILTLFEKRVQAKDLPYFMALTAYLEARGIHCPLPVADRQGVVMHTLKGRPAIIITFLEGQGVQQPEAWHMPLLGQLAARMHLAAKDFPMRLPNTMSFAAWRQLAKKIGARADEIRPGLAKLVAEELVFLEAHWPHGLPSGAVHADLFPDNVFFKGTAVSGVIDFYFACDELWAYDLMIALNAWCFDANHALLPEHARAMLQAYAAVRPVSAAEKAAFPVLARGAALRFLLTRTHDRLFHPAGAQVSPKNPMEYVKKLEFFRTWEGL